MKKIYKAIGTQVSTVLLVNGRSVRVTFYPVSNYEAGKGGSEFMTSDPDLQKALEESGDFGRLYFLKGDNGELVTRLDDDDSAVKTTEKKEENHEAEMEHVKVESLADAKMWLIDNRGWEPKTRVTKKNLMEVAASYGVVFDGME